MATATTLATGVGAAIGGRYDSGAGRLIFAGFYGYVSTVDVATSQFQQFGGYSNPEDVALAKSPSGTTVLYVTDRAGWLLRLDPATGLDRGAASVVTSGLTAPQQIAIEDSGDAAYVIEYVPVGAGTGRLLRVDLTSAGFGTTTPVLGDVTEGVGVTIDASGQLYITEQSGGGKLSQVDPVAGTRVKVVVAANLPAPFFLSWGDAARTLLMVPLRDPYNRIMQVDFSQTDSDGNPRVIRLIDGTPWRPSSVTVLASGHLVVFADQEVTEYDLTSGPQSAVSRGMGGGGTFLDVRLAPGTAGASAPTLVMSSDMTGLYRSVDEGQTWQLQDGRNVMGYDRLSAAFSPASSANPDQLIAAHPTQGLRVGTPSSTSPSGMDWTSFTPALVVNGQPVDLHPYASEPTAAAYSPNGATLLLGTRNGLYVLNSGTWSLVTTATDLVTGGSVNVGDVVAIQWDPSGRAFAADIDHVLWSIDSGVSWYVLEQGPNGQCLPPRKPGGSYADRASRILALAGGTDPRTGVFALYAAVPPGTGSQLPTTAGVYRCDVGSAATVTAPPPWVAMLTSSTVRYGRLAVPAGNADVLHVGVLDDLIWMVYRGDYQPGTASMSWVPTYNGFHNLTIKSNVDPGWIDEAEAPASLGFGFGGPANAIACDPTTGKTAAYVNTAFADISTNATASASAVGWRQIYTEPVPTAAGPRWRTNGSDVTNVWHYYVHPQDSSVHFLANTDICLSRSDDAGDTWQLVMPSRAGTRWGNFYELAFAGGDIYAAVSTEHDLPYNKQFRDNAPPPAGPPEPAQCCAAKTAA